MFKKAPFLTIVLLLPSCLSAAASASVPKVVVVNIQEIGQESKKFASVRKRIETEIHKRGTEIESLKSQFTQILEKVQQGGKDMKPAALEEKQAQLASLKGQIEVKQQGLQAYAEREMRMAEETLIKEIQVVCEKMNYDIVIPGALYTKPQFNVTAQVMAEMDKGVSAAKDEPKKDAPKAKL